MKSRKTTENQVLSQTEEMKDCPLIIQDIGAEIAGYFEIASEVTFANEEDDRIVDLLVRLYGAGKYHEAVMLLKVVFSLIEYEEAGAILSFIGNRNGDKVEEWFIRSFMSKSSRCEVSRIRSLIGADGRKEEQDHE